LATGCVGVVRRDFPALPHIGRDATRGQGPGTSDTYGLCASERNAEKAFDVS
jgi:hypothetical protein